MVTESTMIQHPELCLYSKLCVQCHLSNIMGLHFEDVNAARLKVIPEVVGRDHQHHFTGVTFLSVEFDEHIGVWTATRDVTCLHRDLIVNIWQTGTNLCQHHSNTRQIKCGNKLEL